MEARDLGDGLEQRSEEQQPDDRLGQGDAQEGGLAAQHAQGAQAHLPGLSHGGRHAATASCSASARLKLRPAWRR
jgi:hypothetical protein